MLPEEIKKKRDELFPKYTGSEAETFLVNKQRSAFDEAWTLALEMVGPVIEESIEILGELGIDQADQRKNLRDNLVDDIVLELCRERGFGAVMDSASRQWRKEDMGEISAFMVGSCFGTVRPFVKKARECLKRLGLGDD